MLHIVLYEPMIPQNTGNIMRTCAAINARLHLIQPLGFVLDENRVKRSVMDYIDILDYVVHKDWEAFVASANGTLYYMTRFGKHTHSDVNFANVQGDIYLVFGSEGKGIDFDILKNNIDTTFRIPMSAHARSLNLSNAVAVVGYEVVRQLSYEGLALEEVIKGSDYLDKQ